LDPWLLGAGLFALALIICLVGYSLKGGTSTANGGGAVPALDPKIAELQSQLAAATTDLNVAKNERDARPSVAEYEGVKSRASKLEADINTVHKERDDAIKERDNVRQQLATRPAAQPETSTKPDAPQRIYSVGEKEKLKGLMIRISELLNTDGAEIFESLRKKTAGSLIGFESMSAKDRFDFIKEIQEKTLKLDDQIYRKIIPENKYFERDLKFIVGGDDLKTHGPYQLYQYLAPYFGQLNMVLTLIQKMKEDSTKSTENQLLGMANSDERRLIDAVANFGSWITLCNERIDEKTRNLQ
jgi:hypothetical protein